MNTEVLLTLWTWVDLPEVNGIPATSGYEFRLNEIVKSYDAEVKLLEQWMARYSNERYKITETISYTMFEHIPLK